MVKKSSKKQFGLKKTIPTFLFLFFSFSIFCQENIFISFDKNIHVLGERIWFKADLTPAQNNFLPAEKLRQQARTLTL